MAAIARATVDLAGGVIQNSQGVASTVNGVPPAVHGDAVVSHLPCPNPASHCAATTTGSAGVTVNGIRVVLNGDAASCGHAAVASAASTISPTT